MKMERMVRLMMIKKKIRDLKGYFKEYNKQTKKTICL
jgi:hypothetical protein